MNPNVLRPLNEAAACVNALGKNWKSLSRDRIEKIIVQCDDHLRSVYGVIEQNQMELDSRLGDQLTRIHNDLEDFRTRLPAKGGWFRSLLEKTMNLISRFFAFFTKPSWRINYTAVHSLEDSKTRYE